MQQLYVPFIDRVIDKYEGGYCWDKGDPGGPTNFGITCYDLSEHRHQKMDSMARWAPIVKAMTRKEAEDIYAAKYASALKFNTLPAGIDCVVLDYGINSGILRPIRVAATMLKKDYTGRLDDDLLGAMQKADPKWFIDTMCQERLAYMHRIRNGEAWKEFGGGWGTRVNDLDKYCLALAQNTAPAPAPDLSKVPTPKAQHPVPEVSNKQITVSTGAGGAIAAAIKSLSIPLEVAIVAGVVVVGAGIGYGVYRQYKAIKANNTVILPPGTAHA